MKYKIVVHILSTDQQIESSLIDTDEEEYQADVLSVESIDKLAVLNFPIEVDGKKGSISIPNGVLQNSIVFVLEENDNTDK